MAYSRRMVERARALRGAGLTVMEITEILGGPGKTSVWRWIRDVRKPAGRAGGGMDLPRLVGDGPDYPDIDPEDKDALIERLRLENAVLRAVQDVLKAESLDGMSNREKTLVIDRLRPAGKWSLRELTGFLRISRSSYDYQRRAIARPDRLAPLRDVVRRVFLEDGDGARGYVSATVKTTILTNAQQPIMPTQSRHLRQRIFTISTNAGAYASIDERTMLSGGAGRGG